MISAAPLVFALALAQQSTFLESADSQHVAFPDDRVVVSGLAWFNEDKPVLRRLPAFRLVSG